MGTIQLEDCCTIGYEGILVQKPSENEDLQEDCHPMCLKFNVILMIQVGLKYNFIFFSSLIPPALSNPLKKIHMELNASDSELSMQFSHFACQFLVNNLHFITYFTHTGQSPDRQQPIKESSLKYYPFLLVVVSSPI